MSQTQNPMEFPPLDGLKLWHLLQTHVSAGCGDTLKVNFDGNIHPQHMQDLNVVYAASSSEDQRMKMNSQVLHHHHNDKIPCSCPMCPMSEKKTNTMKQLDAQHLNAHAHSHHILHQPNNQNQNQPNNPQQQQQQQHQQSHKLSSGPSQPPGTSTATTINCTVCHKKIRNTKKQQQAALRQPNYCPLCDKCSRSQKNLYNQNNHHGPSHNNSQNSSLYPHNSHNSHSHNNNNSHHTSVYNNNNSSSGQFSSHSVNDSHLSAHPCKVCKKGFAFKHDLDRHSKASRGDCGKQFKCPKCDKFFSNGGNLKRHAMIHTGEKPYTCHVCNKPFRTKTLLANHIRTHTGEKPFLCHLCEKKFSKSENLKRHVKIHVKHNIV